MLELLALESPAWAGFVGAMPGATPFHHPAWAAMIARCYRFEAFALALPAASGAGEGYVAGFPVIELKSPVTRRRRWSCLPFTDECHALAQPGEARRLADAVEELRVAKGVADVEISGAARRARPRSRASSGSTTSSCSIPTRPSSSGASAPPSGETCGRRAAPG